jgi:hypothetical protein
LAFIACSLLLIVLFTFEKRWLRRALLAVLAITVLIAQSLAGFLTFGILIVVDGFLKIKRGKLQFGLILLLSASIVMPTLASVVENIPIVGRLVNITDQVAEASGYVRVVLPFKAALAALEGFPLGIPNNHVGEFLRERGLVFRSLGAGTGGTDTALMNLFINYGFSAFVLIFLIIYTCRDPLILIYILMVSMFNGSLFTFDKVAVIGLTVLLASQRQNRDQASIGKTLDLNATGNLSVSVKANRLQ